MKILIKFLLISILIFPTISLAQQQKKEKSTDKSKSSAVQTKQDSLISQMVDIAADAYQYRIRPSKDGGGGGSYTGYKLPKTTSKGVKITKLTANQMIYKNGSIVATLDSTGQVKIK